MTLPVVARIQPIAGESLLSLITRSAQANVFTELPAFLNAAGVTGHPAFVAFTAVEHAASLAQLMGVDRAEVESRLHPLHPDQTLKGAVLWAGTRVRRRSTEAKRRRVSPLSLANSPHHRVVWSHRALSFCPESLQMLIDRCDRCGGALGWTRTWGPECCEHCRHPLAEGSAPRVPQDLRARLSKACELLDPDPAIRARAMSRLPGSFAGSEPGDVFHAISEIGVAWERPEEGRATEVARSLMDGSFPFAPEHIASGYELVANWSDGFAALVERLRPHHAPKREQARPAACELGVLGRHLAAGPLTPIRRLLTDAADQYGVERVERGQVQKGRAAETRRKLERGMTLMDASRVFEVSPKVLRRLVPDGGCCIGVGVGRGASVRFDKARLAVAVRAYKGALTFREAAAVLGVPHYCLPAFLGRGLLDRERSRDARLMLGEEGVQRHSLERIHQRLAADPARDGGRSGTLSRFLRRRFLPSTWADALRLTLNRRDVLYAYDAAGRGPLFDRLLIDWLVLHAHLPPERLLPAPEATLTASDVGRVLGISAAHLPEIIGAGLLQATREGGVWNVRLSDVLSFHRKWVISNEYYDRLDLGPGQFRINLTGTYSTEVITRHFALWPRALVEADHEWPYGHIS